jgi:cyclohexyl-isocyanide hydratase
LAETEGLLAFLPRAGGLGFVPFAPGDAGKNSLYRQQGLAPMIDPNQHLQIGSLLFEELDQIDLTGPFEVLSRIPNSTYRIYAKTLEPVRDIRGLKLFADGDLATAPQLDVLHIPGGFGQEALMEDEAVLGWVRRQAASATCVFSVCTGALICGAAGLLVGKRATTHWAAFHLLSHFGAIPVNERVVEDGNLVCAAGVTAGIDGALRLAARLRGDEVAQGIQLYMAYQPEPPFDAGSPERAPAAVVAKAREAVADLTARREATARRIGARLGLADRLAG